MKIRHSAWTIGLATALTTLVTTASAETIKIGMIGGQTGSLAFSDQPFLMGAQLEAKKINAAGGIMGKQIEIIARDTRSDTAEAAVMAQEVLSEGAVVLNTPCDGDPTIAAGSIAQAAGVLAFSGCASAPVLPGIVGDHLYLNPTADNFQATGMALYAREVGYTNVAVLLSPDSAYTQNLPKYFSTVFGKEGGTIATTIEYRMNQQDFGVEVSKIKALDPAPDLIMTAAYEPDFPAFLQQLRAAGITTPVIGSDGLDSPTILALGSIADGLVYAASGLATPGGSIAAFDEKFAAEYGEPSGTILSALGSDLILVIKDAVERAEGKLDGASLIAAVEQIENLPVTTGTITYKGANRVALRSVSVIKIEDGQKVLLKKITPTADQVPTP